MAKATDLSGLRILVVEDNYLVADVLCEQLREFGCEVIGPAPNLERSVKLIDTANGDKIDGALLDINLGDCFSFPIATKLSKLGVPFIFLTGYDDRNIVPDEFRSVRRISKPCNVSQLARTIQEAF